MVDLAKGTISTFAGDGKGKHSGDGGPAGLASIHGARAVEVSPDGTIWILERQGNTLRAVDPKSGVINVRAGTGKAGYTGDGGLAIEATFNGPKEMCFDKAGNIYVVDTENHAIRRIDSVTRRMTTVAGDGHRPGPGESHATTERLDRPHGVAEAPDGSIIIGDTGNNRIRAVRPR
jgi:streptogramin lyase